MSQVQFLLTSARSGEIPFSAWVDLRGPTAATIRRKGEPALAARA
jgi:hypothetical protein